MSDIQAEWSEKTIEASEIIPGNPPYSIFLFLSDFFENDQSWKHWQSCNSNKNCYKSDHYLTNMLKQSKVQTRKYDIRYKFHIFDIIASKVLPTFPILLSLSKKYIHTWNSQSWKHWLWWENSKSKYLEKSSPFLEELELLDVLEK